MAIKRYLHYFQTKNDFNNDRGRNYKEPWTSFTVETRDVNYNKTEEEKLLSMPFTIEMLESGTVSWNLHGLTVKYSKNGGPWTAMNSGTTIQVSQGDEVAFKGENSRYSYYDEEEGDYLPMNLMSSARFNAKGNIMSLTDGDDFVQATAVTEYAFFRFFNDPTGENIVPIVSAERLKLPAVGLSPYCYFGMFMVCEYLETAPKLPAMIMATSCYDSMFQECSSLTTPPELPSTTLAYGCYSSMFLYCDSLIRTPEFPATSLAEYCYAVMFRGCTNLRFAAELPATSLTQYCYSNMFRGCTSLEESPVLPATNLERGCYGDMFSGCSNLKRIEAMFLTTPSNTYTSSWVSGVSSTGTFVKNSSAQWNVTGNNGVPTGWTIETK